MDKGTVQKKSKEKHEQQKRGSSRTASKDTNADIGMITRGSTGPSKAEPGKHKGGTSGK
jgi:hypothetical protein